VEIEYRISEDDYVGAVKLAAVATKRQLLWLSLLGIILLLFAIFGERSLKFMGIFGIAGGIIGYFLTVYIISPWKAKQQYRNYKLLHQDLSIAFTDTGYIMKAPNGENTVKWSDLLRWRENKEYILIYFAPKLFHLIPKRLSDKGLDINKIEHDLHSQLGSAT
jgi:hypothetical protein